MSKGREMIKRARDLAVPKIGPLLFGQLLFYMVGLGLCWVKVVKPGLGAFGIEVTTTSDKVAAHGERLDSHDSKIKCIDGRLHGIEFGLRILVAELAPDQLAKLPPMASSNHGHGP